MTGIHNGVMTQIKAQVPHFISGVRVFSFES